LKFYSKRLIAKQTLNPLTEPSESSMWHSS